MTIDLSQYKLPNSPTPANGLDLSQYKTAATASPAVPSDAGMLDHISNFVSSIFPGKEIGNALGENLYGMWRLVHGDYQGFSQAADEVGNRMKPIVGDTANALITPASMLVGGPAAQGAKAAATRVATNIGVGAALGGANAASTGGSIKQGAEGGAAIGGIGSAGGEILNSLLTHLPVRLVRGVLPKLTPGNEQSVLEKTKLGSVSSMLDDAANAVQGHGKQIDQILASPQYANHLGDGNGAIQKAVAAFPNSEYDAPSIVQTVKDLIPQQSKLVSKIQQGTAVLGEKNTVRKALDAATKKRFTDAPQLTASKEIGAKVADTLRHEVQSHAPETQPIFKTLTKELDVRNALSKAQQKIDGKANVGLLDILSYMGGGIPGIVGEKIARSPAAAIGIAKALSAGGKALPAIDTAARAARAPIIKAATTPAQRRQQ
jgi:hypothetical protein